MARNRFFDDETVAKKLDMGLFGRFLKYLAPYKGRVLFSLVFLISSMVLSLLVPIFTQKIVDDVIPKGDYKLLTGLIIALIITLFASVILATIKGVWMTNVGQGVVYDLRKDAFSHLQKLSFDYFDDRPTGKILVRITSYIDNLSTLLSDGIINLITDALSIGVVIVIMVSINLKLAVISMIMFVPLALVVLMFKNILHKKYQSVNVKSSNRTAFIHENIMGAKVIQTFNRESKNADVYADLNDDVTKTWINAFLTNNIMWPSIEIISTAGAAFTYFAGYKFLIDGTVSLGTIMAFTAYITKIWQPLNNLSAVYNQFLNAMANIEKIFEMMDEKPMVEDEEGAQELPQISGDVEFSDVTFGYVKDVNVLENINFHVKPGQTIALVGPSGAGKTTVISLISRFYNLNGGKILIDGRDIKNVTLRSLRSQMGIIMQDSFIFEGTVMDNIRYGKLNATDEEVINAAKTVHADDFIKRLPKGYNTKLEERGAGLSTGERQLISFARVILSDPKILILDEATACIDTKTEEKIQKALDVLLEGRTSFVIAHRLSTIRNADNIMYVGNKKREESGTHDERVAKKGKYYELHASQYRAI